MTKLCPRGKAAAKRKFKVYPSAYANAYASKICAGKIKDPSGVKRKDFRGSKAKGGRIGLDIGGPPTMTKEELKKDFDVRTKRGASKKGVRMGPKTFFVGKEDPRLRKGSFGTGKKDLGKRKPAMKGPIGKLAKEKPRRGIMGGGLMEATARLKRQGLRGGGICKKGMNRQAVGKNS